MVMMLFTATGFAETAKQTEADVAKEKFNVMVADIVKTVEASYKAKDSFVLYHEPTEESASGWSKHYFDELEYDVIFYEPKASGEPMRATLETMFYWYFAEPRNHEIPYFKTKQEAEAIPCDYRINNPNAIWCVNGDDRWFVLFTYEYKNGRWNLVRSQHGYQSFTILGSGYDNILHEMDRHMEYKDFSDKKIHQPLDVLLAKNHKKNPFIRY